MRLLAIRHLTEYIFSTAVTLQPHRLLLRPREGHDLRINSSVLDISPTPTIRWHRDMFDNSVAIVSFPEPASRLTIVSDVVIRHYDETPFDFVVANYAAIYPFEYDSEEKVNLYPFQRPIYADDSRAVQNWLGSLGLQQASGETYVLLDKINRAIANGLLYARREEAGVQSPAATLACGSGSCRDFAALFMETCRHLGLASRFVSGYLHDATLEVGGATTHAWTEVYLPGAGWKGFDSTSGKITGSDHIPAAVARHPETIAPVAGSFIGPAGQLPILNVHVEVRNLPVT